MYRFTLSPDQKGIETYPHLPKVRVVGFTLSPDQKGIETKLSHQHFVFSLFTLSPDQKGIETCNHDRGIRVPQVHTEPRSKGD